MKINFRSSLSLIFGLTLLGCSTYTQPSGAPLSEASLTGSRIPNLHQLKIDTRIFPIEIDGNHIIAPGFRNTPILLTSGNHQITFNIVSENLGGTGSINANFEPGKSYILRMSNVSAPANADVWVETSDGSLITDKTAVSLQGPDVIVPLIIAK